MFNQLLKRWKRTPESSIAATTTDELENTPTLLFQIDEPFSSLYQQGLDITGTPDRGDRRKARFYNLIQLLHQTSSLQGHIAECGCWKGLSSFLMCNFLAKWEPEFTGEGMHIFDSFEGLSSPNEQDVITRSLVNIGIQRQGNAFKQAGAYAAEKQHVEEVLKDFPAAKLIMGWLPEVLQKQEHRQYRFVHIDLDLYEPIKGSAEYFYTHLVPGGIIVCDDYGSLFWPGAKQAFDEIADAHGLNVMSLASGQAVLFKPHN